MGDAVTVSLDAAFDRVTLADVLRAAATLSEGTQFFFPTARAVVYVGRQPFHPRALFALAARRHLPRELTPADFGPADGPRLLQLFADFGFRAEPVGDAGADEPLPPG